MKHLLIFSFFSLAFSNIYSQTIDISAPDSSITAIDLSNLTVMLYQPVSGEMGTGTIIRHKNKYYLLTANHVAKLMHNSAKIIFHVGDDQPGVIDLIQFSKNRNLNWINHPVADLSIMELIPFDKNTQNRLILTSFPSKWILPANINLGDSFDFTYLGFPVVDLDMKHFSPLIFNSKRASGLITQARLDDKTKKCDFFYLDKPSMQGCSGSGVYISVKTNSMYQSAKKTFLVGVVHGTQGDDTGGKLAMITTSSYVLDLIEALK